MKKIIVFGIVLSLVGLVSFVGADYAHVGLDSVFTDWADVSKVTDPIDDDQSPKMQDIAEVAIANDEISLYFYVRVDDTNDDQFGGDGNTPPFKHEELHFYLDCDGDTGTGALFGPDGAQVVAEFRLRTTRKADPSEDQDSGQSELEWWFSTFGSWFPTGWTTKKMGIPDPVTVLTGVNEIEARVPYKGLHDKFKLYTSYFPYLPLEVGDTITYQVLALRGTDGDPCSVECDWLDTPQTYTIVSGCGDPNHLYPEGDLNRDCRVDSDDLKMLTVDWLDCTDPNGDGCEDIL